MVVWREPVWAEASAISWRRVQLGCQGANESAANHPSNWLDGVGDTTIVVARLRASLNPAAERGGASVADRLNRSRWR